jgi:hypothetical protein
VPDIYAAIAELDRETQGRLAELIEARAADPRQRAMLRSAEAKQGPGSGTSLWRAFWQEDASQSLPQATVAIARPET